jgi:phage head maturation protease
MSRDYSHLEPGARYRVTDNGRTIKIKSAARKQVLQGWACHYNVAHKNYRTNGDELFLPGCFAGTLWGTEFRRDHILTEEKMADQDDGDMELLDGDQGLAIRVHLKEGVLERLEGRRALSVGYRTLQATLRSDGVMQIKSAALVEISACDVPAVRQCFLEIKDADEVGALAEESKTFAYTGAALGFTRALAKL